MNSSGGYGNSQISRIQRKLPNSLYKGWKKKTEKPIQLFSAIYSRGVGKEKF